VDYFASSNDAAFAALTFSSVETMR